MKRLFRFILFFVSMAAVAACSSSQPVVDPPTLLAFCKDPSSANMDNLSKNYASMINKTRKTGLKQPGIYSDYAVTLVKQGRRAEANTWFNKEIAEFASSRGYVMQLKRTLLPEYVNDNTINDSIQAESDSVLPPEKRAAAEKRAASALDEKNEKQNND